MEPSRHNRSSAPTPAPEGARLAAAGGATLSDLGPLMARADALQLRAPELALVLGERAAALAESAGADEQWIRAESLVVSARVRLGDRTGAVGRAVAALRAAEHAGYADAAARLRIDLAICARSLGMPLTGLAALRPVLSEPSVSRAYRAEALCHLVGCLAQFGRKPELDRVLVEADKLVVADESLDADTRLLMRALLRNGAAAHRRRHGDLTAAADAARTGLGFLEKLHDPADDGGLVRVRLVLQLVSTLLDRGDAEMAYEIAEPMLAAPVRAAGVAPAAWLRLAVATRVHLPAGAGDAAAELVREAVASTDRHDLPAITARLWLDLGQIEERFGSADEAIACLYRSRAADHVHSRARRQACGLLAGQFGADAVAPLDLDDVIARSAPQGGRPVPMAVEPPVRDVETTALIRPIEDDAAVAPVRGGAAAASVREGASAAAASVERPSREPVVPAPVVREKTPKWSFGRVAEEAAAERTSVMPAIRDEPEPVQPALATEERPERKVEPVARFTLSAPRPDDPRAERTSVPAAVKRSNDRPVNGGRAERRVAAVPAEPGQASAVSGATRSGSGESGRRSLMPGWVKPFKKPAEPLPPSEHPTTDAGPDELPAAEVRSPGRRDADVRATETGAEERHVSEPAAQQPNEAPVAHDLPRLSLPDLSDILPELPLAPAPADEPAAPLWESDEWAREERARRGDGARGRKTRHDAEHGSVAARSVLDRLGISAGGGGGRRRADESRVREEPGVPVRREAPELAPAPRDEVVADGSADPWLPKLRMPPALDPLEDFDSWTPTSRPFPESYARAIAEDEPPPDAGLAELLARALAEHQAGTASAAALAKKLGPQEAEKRPVNGYGVGEGKRSGD